jgi:hypothetical protein
VAEVEIRVNSWDFNFDFLISDAGAAVDISGATVKRLRFRRQDGSKFEFAASFKTDGTDGYLRWTPTEGQIRADDEGTWQVEAYLEGVTSWSGPTRPASFYVQPRL